MDLYGGYLRDSAERIERALRVVWGEVAPRTYADVPTYGDMPTYGNMERAFGGKENWPKRNIPTEFPAEPRFRPTYGPLPAKDWNAAANPAAFLLPPKEFVLNITYPIDFAFDRGDFGRGCLQGFV